MALKGCNSGAEANIIQGISLWINWHTVAPIIPLLHLHWIDESKNITVLRDASFLDDVSADVETFARTLNPRTLFLKTCLTLINRLTLAWAIRGSHVSVPLVRVHRDGLHMYFTKLVYIILSQHSKQTYNTKNIIIQYYRLNIIIPFFHAIF